MKIRNFKKKCKTWSIVLIITGLLITLSGFAMNSFSNEAFQESNGHHWYQTIRYEESTGYQYTFRPNENISFLNIQTNLSPD